MEYAGYVVAVGIILVAAALAIRDKIAEHRDHKQQITAITAVLNLGLSDNTTRLAIEAIIENPVSETRARR